MCECQNNKDTNHLQSHGTIYPGISEDFFWVNLDNVSVLQVNVIIPILQMRRPSNGEIKQPAQGRSTGRWTLKNASEPARWAMVCLVNEVYQLIIACCLLDDHVLLMYTVKQLPHFIQEVATFQSRRE